MIRWLLIPLLCLIPSLGLAQNFGNIKPNTVIGNPDNTASKPAVPMPFAEVAPVVLTNADLIAANVADYSKGVWRKDYADAVGAPPLYFRPQLGITCATNSLQNDGGTCVNAVGGSFVAVYPENRADVRQWGCKFDGNVTDCAPSIQTAIRNGSEGLGLTIVFPAGKSYRLNSTVQSSGAGPNGVNIDFNNSTAIVTHVGTVYKFDQSQLIYRVKLVGPAWITAQTATAVAACFDVQFPTIGSHDNGPVLTQSKLYCLSSDQTYATAPFPNSFTEGFRYSGTWYADITDPWFVGPGSSLTPAVPFAGVHAFVFYGNHNLAPLIRGGFSNKTDVTFQFLTYTEGTMINGFTDVSSNKGIFVDPTITAVGGRKINGLFVDKGSSFASWIAALEVHDGQYLDIESVLFQQGYDGVHPFTGALIDGTLFSKFHSPVTGQPADPGAVGYDFTNVSAHNFITGTTLSTLKTGVRLGPNTINNTGTFAYNLDTILPTLVVDNAVSTAGPYPNSNDIGPRESGVALVQFHGTAPAGSFAATTNQVFWEQTGRTVNVHGLLAGTLTGAGGSLIMDGLPRMAQLSPSTATLLGAASNPCLIGLYQGLVGLDGGRTQIGLVVQPGQFYANFYEFGPGLAPTLMGPGNWAVSTGFGINFSCTYRTW